MNYRVCRACSAFVLVLLNLLFSPLVNAQGKAALTRDVDRPTAQPVNGKCETGSIPGSGFGKCALFKVPAAKRLVVETISYIVFVDSQSRLFQILFGQDAGFPTIFFGLPNTFVIAPMTTFDDGIVHSYGGSQPLVIYIDENQTLDAGFVTGGGTNFTQSFTFSGYLVDK